METYLGTCTCGGRVYFVADDGIGRRACDTCGRDSGAGRPPIVFEEAEAARAEAGARWIARRRRAARAR